MVFFHAAGGEAPGLAPWGEGGDPLAIEMPPVKGEKAGFVFYFFFFFSPFSLSLYARRCLRAVRREETDIYVWLDGVWPSIISEHQRQDYVPGYEWIYSL